MLIKEYEGHKPNLHPTVRVAENATIVGKATLAEDVNVWYSAVIRADGAEIVIGARTNIQDAAVLHCDSGSPVHVGKNVVIGHGAIVHSCTVGDNSLIGMAAGEGAQTHHRGTAGVHDCGRQALCGAGKKAAGSSGGGIKALELVHIKGAKPKEAKGIWIR